MSYITSPVDLKIMNANAAQATLTLGQVAAIVGVCVAVTFTATGYMIAAARSESEVASLRTDMQKQSTEFTRTIRDGFASFENKIASLPDQRARLDQVEKRLAENNAHDDQREGRMNGMGQSIAEMRATLDQLARDHNAAVLQHR